VFICGFQDEASFRDPLKKISPPDETLAPTSGKHRCDVNPDNHSEIDPRAQNFARSTRRAGEIGAEIFSLSLKDFDIPSEYLDVADPKERNSRQR